MAQISGAFDLSQVAPKAAAPGGTFVTELTEATFESTLRGSLKYPIVVEFYSSRAPESSQMGQALAELANEAGGSWLLARMNVDTSPQIVAQLQIRAVPMVVGVLSGQMVPLWQGSMPKEDAAKVISELLKMAAGNGILGKAEPQGPVAEEGAEPVEDPRYTPAYDSMGAGDYAQAVIEFEKVLAATPGDAEAKVGKAQAGLLARVSVLDPAKVQAAATQDEPTIDAILDAADLDVATGAVEQAFSRLTTAIASTSGDDRDKLRLRLLELFDTQDPSDKVVLSARRNLATALF
ncbi:MAG: tetratricopeptide repeat protein [Propionibacteriaceae bacterium]|nr:tetratricopeptide repeat protein [Propionibacteriaceae bacterium]